MDVGDHNAFGTLFHRDREPAQLIGRQSALGNVLDGADQLDRLALFEQRKALHPCPDRTSSLADERQLQVKRRCVLDRGIDGRPDDRLCYGRKGIDLLLKAGHAGRLHVINAEAFARPIGFHRLQIEFPATNPGNFSGALQQLKRCR